jgi:hypothetical protein
MSTPDSTVFAKFVAAEIEKATAPLLARIEKLERALTEAETRRPDTAIQKLKSLVGGS